MRENFPISLLPFGKKGKNINPGGKLSLADPTVQERTFSNFPNHRVNILNFITFK